MIEIWMKNHLVSGSKYNIKIHKPPITFTRNDNNVGLTLSVGDTKYHS